MSLKRRLQEVKNRIHQGARCSVHIEAGKVASPPFTPLKREPILLRCFGSKHRTLQFPAKNLEADTAWTDEKSGM